MMKQFFKALFTICIYTASFIILVWVLLGIPPKEAYVRTGTNLTRIFQYAGRFAGDMHKTSKDMKNAGEQQLEEASARMEGRDLGLERLDKSLRESMK